MEDLLMRTTATNKLSTKTIQFCFNDSYMLDISMTISGGYSLSPKPKYVKLMDTRGLNKWVTRRISKIVCSDKETTIYFRYGRLRRLWKDIRILTS